MAKTVTAAEMKLSTHMTVNALLKFINAVSTCEKAGMALHQLPEKQSNE